MRIVLQRDAYRIVEMYDEHATFDELKGDCYSPSVNKDVNPETLKQQELEFEELVRVEGVYGYELQHWNSEIDGGWEHVDSCWGFVGQYSKQDERFNHYIVEELEAQIPSKP